LGKRIFPGKIPTYPHMNWKNTVGEKMRSEFIKGINRKISLLDRMRHRLNPLHFYCRLTHLGVSPKTAMCICRVYETGIYKSILGS